MAVRDFIGLDIGEKRTGIARASSIARLAEPLKTVPTSELGSTLAGMKDQIEALIVGLPRNLDGNDTPQTEWVKKYMAVLKPQLNDVPLYWQDEALTTKLAELRQAKNPTEIDSYAASIILQDFLDERQK